MFSTIVYFLPLSAMLVQGKYFSKCSALEHILKNEAKCTYIPDEYLNVVSISCK